MLGSTKEYRLHFPTRAANPPRSPLFPSVESRRVEVTDHDRRGGRNARVRISHTLTLPSTCRLANNVSCTAPMAWWPTRTKSLPSILRSPAAQNKGCEDSPKVMPRGPSFGGASNGPNDIRSLARTASTMRSKSFGWR